MPKITYIEAGGAVHSIDGKVGQSVMETAVKNKVPGIIGECGGSAACGTCRVYPEPEWRDKLAARSDIENEMIEFTGDTNPAVRLGCQIKITGALDGLTVRMPADQT